MITGIVMASGFSNRMGKDKLLIEINGKKIIEWVLEAVKASNLNEIILIYRTKEIKRIADSYGIKTVYNPNAHLGQSQSVILGVENSKSDTYMFFVCDQPFISSELINNLIEEYNESPSKIVIPYYQGKINMPIIFPPDFKEDLLKVEGDKGGREIIHKNPTRIKKVEVQDEILLKDIDTIEDSEEIRVKNCLG
ncbi:nucleotidyltransferase family protein [Paratissierella segnis]|jgi:molybdenum cofactor cytidylyltransferase|uniref:Nucleotidyltransferase family protein n=1 Tax=Paratissierella segnis TaxID=2763679 RepID=A0A926EX77_9FIRM|nr:nucleotidyltransferase family protein [Paratissierella segnis]MBC8587905.1 nucleotidyltransferase family protein [Paratissierella segnis]